MNYYYSLLALVRRMQKRQALAFKLRNLILQDTVAGLAKTAKAVLKV